jgi:predicted murein hydrolase (TIGR00659 family)
MSQLLSGSIFFGVFISIIGYQVGLFLRKKFKLSIFNPLLISIIFVVIVLLIFRVKYDDYNNGAKYLSYLLTPATICLAVPLYEQIDLLKKNVVAILVGITAGVLSSMGSVLVFSILFHFSHAEYVTLLPKSITTAIGMGVSEELGGIVTITVAVIIITGVLGNIIAEWVCRIFSIKDPIAKGLALGTSSHAIGTARAMEMGEIEGAMSSLAIAVAGLITVIGATIFANFM